MTEQKKYCFFSSIPRKKREVIMYRQARALLSEGFQVYNVVSDDGPTIVDRGVHLIPTGYIARNFFQRIFIAPRQLFKKLIEVDADIYHTVHIDQLLICLLLKRQGKKVFFEMQEGHPYSLLWKSQKPKWFLKCLVWMMAKWMGYVLKKVDAISVLSQEIKAYVLSWGVSPDRVHILGNFPEVNKDYQLSLEEYMSRENRILYFGIIYSYSRQEVFLKALSKVPGVNYLVAGIFMGNEQDSYKPKIINMPEWQGVEFIEGFNHHELSEMINRSTISNVLRDFSIYANTKNGSYGIIKIFESMEAALPIICSDVPIYRDIMKEYKCGILVNPLNEEQIKDAIEYLVSHKEEAWRMGQEGRRAVIEKYSWDVASKKYLSIISSM